MTPSRRPTQVPHWRRSFVLIDVVAALVLFSSTIVALLSAQSRALQQLAASQQQRQAAHLAEGLLATWSLEERDVTTPDEATFEGHAGWFWRRTAESAAVAVEADLTEVQVEILRTDETGQVQTVARFVWLEFSNVIPRADGQS